MNAGLRAAFKDRNMQLLILILCIPTIAGLVAMSIGYNPWLVQFLASCVEIVGVAAIFVKLTVSRQHKRKV
jgi:hypothetical protein